MATDALGLEGCGISKFKFSLFEATSQNLIAGSEAPAEIRYRLSRLKVNAGTGAGVGCRGGNGLPESGSSSSLIPFIWPMARSRPSGLNAILVTRSVKR